MKDIYNIYESLLGDIENAMSKGEDIMIDYNNTVENKLINIISLAGGLNVKETMTLRSMLSQVQRTGGEELVSHFPVKLRDTLIVASKRKLSVQDFNELPTSIEAYGRYCNAVYNLLQSSCDIKDLKQQAKSKSGDIVNGPKNIQVAKLGNAIIFTYKKFMYVKIKDLHRIIIEAK